MGTVLGALAISLAIDTTDPGLFRTVPRTPPVRGAAHFC
jgi:hypothetical protein